MQKTRGNPNEFAFIELAKRPQHTNDNHVFPHRHESGAEFSLYGLKIIEP